MPTPSLVNGDVWTEALANASIRPTIETDATAGIDDPGSVAQVVDENLNPAPQYIRARVNRYLNRMKLTAVPSSLTLEYSGAMVSKNSSTAPGAIVPGQVILPNNQTSFVYVEWSGSNPTVSYSTTQAPYGSELLAVVVTAGGDITQLYDMRDQEVIQLKELPPIPTVKVGTLRDSLDPNPEPGELSMVGQLISKIDYPQLFNLLGYQHGGSGNNFRLPDARGRISLNAGPGFAGGSVGGSNTKQLSVDELPVHNHPISDPGHTHDIAGYAHSHAIQDRTHSHGVADPGHFHTINDPGHDHRAENHRGASLNGDVNDATGAELSTQGRGALMPVKENFTRISILPRETGIAIDVSSTGITTTQPSTNQPQAATKQTGITATGNRGSGAAFSLLPAYLVVYRFVKAG